MVAVRLREGGGNETVTPAMAELPPSAFVDSAPNGGVASTPDTLRQTIDAELASTIDTNDVLSASKVIEIARRAGLVTDEGARRFAHLNIGPHVAAQVAAATAESVEA